ncbi:MAG: sulfite exporter TauE/SafE family protein [Betaproteobacteria bacterium]
MDPAFPWWIWPIALFAVSFAIGIVAVLGGVGGGVLFVPIVGSFFPFHLDFVRGAGLLLALTGALAAGPSLLRSGLASIRLGMPLALAGSITSIAGAVLGLALPVQVLQVALGLLIFAIAALMALGQTARSAPMPQADALSAALRMHGAYRDQASGEMVAWRVHRAPAALFAFAGIGLMAGMFGLGAGWANVPVLNLLMGAPLKVAVGTSGFVLAVVDSTAAWVYIHRGAMLPILVVPAVLGVMLGSRLGARLLFTTSTLAVRRIVVAVMAIAGARALLRGLGVWN